jgi:hypothetical protein
LCRRGFASMSETATTLPCCGLPPKFSPRKIQD